MTPDLAHKILIVESDEKIISRITSLLNSQTIRPAYYTNSTEALQTLKTDKTPFSVIISAQILNEDMNGTELLMKAKEISPDTTRFLMTASSDIRTTIAAVNEGSIHHCLLKPWEDEDFLLAVNTGIEYFTSLLEHKKLIKLAKKQNTKLYELNCDLMETQKSYSNKIQKLEDEIQELKSQVETTGSTQDSDNQNYLEQISDYIKTDNGVDNKKVQTLFIQSLNDMYSQFDELAQRNGFEMPALKGKIK